MDLPNGLDQWQWQQIPIQVLGQQTAYQLTQPEQPDWQQLNRWYPDCTDARLNNYWVCVIGDTTWSFFEFEQQRWVLMPVVIPKVSRESALPLGLDILSQSQSNGYRITVYFSNKPYNLLQRQLRFRLAQLIARVETLEQEDDLWILEGEHGRLVFSRHENWTFVTLMQ